MIKTVFKKPYVFIFIFIFVLYLILNIILSQFYITIRLIPYYLSTIKWFELVLSEFLSLIIAFLVSTNFTLVYLKWKERKIIKGRTFVASLGAIAGFSTGICTACVSGLFPLIFGFFGVGFSFLSLPLKGIEIQIIVILLLVVNFYFLNKNSSSALHNAGSKK